MKLNKKGFAISTILYGLLALIILLIMLIFAVMRSNNTNNKELGEQIEKELSENRNCRICKNNSDDPKLKCQDACSSLETSK